MKLLLELEAIEDDSLLLIDELELAIHPRAQSRIFSHLEEMAHAKNLTIIFSTHSVSLIKGIDRRKLLFLENVNGTVTCLPECYPAYALGHITAGEERAPDCVVYVEDDSARKCFHAMLDLYRARRGVGTVLPTTVVVPLGGFREILVFLDRAPQMLPNHTRVRATLDRDVEVESLADYQARNDLENLALFQRTSASVNYLPWTPEVGLVELINADIPRHERALKQFFNDARINLPANFGRNIQGLTSGRLRNACKESVFQIVQLISRLLGRSDDAVRADLYKYLVEQTEAGEPGRIVRTVATVLYN